MESEKDKTTRPTGRPRNGRTFTDADIRSIRKDQRKYREVADEFGVSITLIFKIKIRTIYQDVRDDV